MAVKTQEMKERGYEELKARNIKKQMKEYAPGVRDKRGRVSDRPVTVLMTPDLKIRLDQVRQQHGITRTFITQKGVEMWLDKFEAESGVSPL